MLNDAVEIVPCVFIVLVNFFFDLVLEVVIMFLFLML